MLPLLDFTDLDRFVGHVTVSNGIETVTGCNLVVYTGGDIIANLLAGNTAWKISQMAFEYQNTTGTPTPAAAARTDTVASALTALTGAFDYLRGGLIASPLLSAGDANHNSNRAQFTALSTATQGVHGVAFGAASNSKIYAMSLLASPTGVASGDVMYARYILTTPLPAAGAGQVTASWLTEAR